MSLGAAGVELPPPVVHIANPTAVPETPAAWAMAPSRATAVRRVLLGAIRKIREASDGLRKRGFKHTTEPAVRQRANVKNDRIKSPQKQRKE